MTSAYILSGHGDTAAGAHVGPDDPNSPLYGHTSPSSFLARVADHRVVRALFDAVVGVSPGVGAGPHLRFIFPALPGSQTILFSMPLMSKQGFRFFLTDEHHSTPAKCSPRSAKRRFLPSGGPATLGTHARIGSRGNPTPSKCRTRSLPRERLAQDNRRRLGKDVELGVEVSTEPFEDGD